MAVTDPDLIAKKLFFTIVGLIGTFGALVFIFVA